MLTRQAILTPPEPVHVETFCERLRERVAIKSSVEWADEPSFADRFVQAVAHPGVAVFAKVTFAGSVWFTGLAAAVVILLLIQGA